MVNTVFLAQLSFVLIYGQTRIVLGIDFKPRIIEGDILAGKKLLRLIKNSQPNRQKRAARKGHLHLWEDGLIPYEISENMAEKTRKVIRRAFRRLASKTCIRFIPKQPEHEDYVEFIQGIGCYSSVGKKKGRQVISLGVTCQTRAKAVHEIMHALGFFHEHSRPDRDNYVKILYWNILEGQEKNFVVYSHDRVDSLSAPYDYKSIMHYDNKAFTKNGKDTIQAKDNPHLRLGDGVRLSKIDIQKIRELYKCDRRRAKLHGKGVERVCQDKIPGCRSYCESGDSCESNYAFMKEYCEQSCGFCGRG